MPSMPYWSSSGMLHALFLNVMPRKVTFDPPSIFSKRSLPPA